eukprot:CAMPEP_0206038112 /NCGR_PEP_ID=MMETSP1466-20131121/3892_1 /ASSEMBLY_ACC=CAM_ASM_001126 /TAXON_ID=44452 /ORGANISM="Pavlova gyrans, Strain CCMP608" /LENGTH=130 /DNA_ID=CAMNT_0053412699 /DNA_START=41 /DNA_END=433 /DNA_ORIENTATION=+
MMRSVILAALCASASAFVSTPRVGTAGAKLALSKAMSTTAARAAPVASLAPLSGAELASSMTTAMGLEVNFGAYLAVILGTLVPVIFLVILFIKSNAEGTATTFRWPELDGGGLFDSTGEQSRFGTKNSK